MKKSLKKVVALVSLVMCASCTMVTPLNASATSTYLQGDVNGDGSVNVSDTQAARQFLQGMKSANSSTAGRLDVNENGIIDENDVDKIRNIVLHLENGGTSQNTDALPSQEDMTYYVYNASSGVLVDNYTLYKSDVPAISSVSTRTIIGDDNRVPEHGLNGVLQTSTGGTAFVIDDHTILTAAHCIFNGTAVNQAIGGVSFTAYSDYDTPMAVNITPVEYHIPKKFAELSTYNNDYDYAIVTVQEDLSAYVNFTLGVMGNNILSKNSNVDIYVTGFGWGGTGVNPSLIGVKSTGKGNLISSNAVTQYDVNYETDIIGGDSGGPVYVDNGSVKTVIGINTSQVDTYNIGRRITTDILQFVYNNPNL